MSSTKLYQYGSDPENQIELLPEEADAANKLRITVIDETTGHVRVNLNEEEMAYYDSAAIKLNKYLETHTVRYTEEDAAADIPILQLVK